MARPRLVNHADLHVRIEPEALGRPTNRARAGRHDQHLRHHQDEQAHATSDGSRHSGRHGKGGCRPGASRANTERAPALPFAGLTSSMPPASFRASLQAHQGRSTVFDQKVRENPTTPSSRYLANVPSLRRAAPERCHAWPRSCSADQITAADQTFGLPLPGDKPLLQRVLHTPPEVVGGWSRRSSRGLGPRKRSG